MTNLSRVFNFINARVHELKELARKCSGEIDMWHIHIHETGLKPDNVSPGVVSLVSPPMLFYIENRITDLSNKCKEAWAEIEMLEAYRESLTPCSRCSGSGTLLFSYASDDAHYEKCSRCDGRGRL